MVPAMHAGDDYSLLFTQSGATVTVSGKLIGTITQQQFADAMLATFLGPKPASPRLKRIRHVHHACQYGIAVLALHAVGVSTTR